MKSIHDVYIKNFRNRQYGFLQHIGLRAREDMVKTYVQVELKEDPDDISKVINMERYVVFFLLKADVLTKSVISEDLHQ